MVRDEHLPGTELGARGQEATARLREAEPALAGQLLGGGEPDGHEQPGPNGVQFGKKPRPAGLGLRAGRAPDLGPPPAFRVREAFHDVRDPYVPFGDSGPLKAAP